MEDSEESSAQRDICQNDVVNEVSEALRQTPLHWDTQESKQLEEEKHVLILEWTSL